MKGFFRALTVFNVFGEAAGLGDIADSRGNTFVCVDFDDIQGVEQSLKDAGITVKNKHITTVGDCTLTIDDKDRNRAARVTGDKGRF